MRHRGGETPPARLAEGSSQEEVPKSYRFESFAYVQTGAEWEQDATPRDTSMTVVHRGEKKGKDGKKVEYEVLLPTYIVREFNELHRDLMSQFRFAEDERESYARKANVKFTRRDNEYDFKARALACVMMGQQYPEMVRGLQKQARISKSSYYKYRDLLQEENSDLSTDSLALKLAGNQRCYSAKTDAEFLDVLKNPQTSLRRKTTEGLMELYDEIAGGENKVTRQHISYLLHRNNWTMAKPKTLDALRCIDYETLDKWFGNKRVREVLQTVDKRLLFNADETELNRKGGAPRWIATEQGIRVTYITKDHTGSHVSLFLMVSASGKPVIPFALLHGPPQCFAEGYDNGNVKCYLTKKGYMNSATFDLVMRDLFIPYVKSQRMFYGHRSRYNVGTLLTLRENHIHLIVIPAHSSHLLQPLDLNLNHLLKEKYKKEYAVAERQLMKEKTKIANGGDATEEMEAPPTKRRKISTVPPTQKRKTRVVRRTKKRKTSTPKAEVVAKSEEEKKVVELTLAERRQLMIHAATCAVQQSLFERPIESAWKASHLFPLQEHPPYSPEKAESLKQQAREMGCVPGGKRKIVHLTGVLTDEDAIADIQALIDRRGKIKGRAFRYTKITTNSLGQTSKMYEVAASLADVGNYAVLDDDEDASHKDAEKDGVDVYVRSQYVPKSQRKSDVGAVALTRNSRRGRKKGTATQLFAKKASVKKGTRKGKRTRKMK